MLKIDISGLINSLTSSSTAKSLALGLESTKMCEAIARKAYNSLKDNTSFSTPLSRGNLRRYVKASIKASDYRTKARIYISNNSATKHIYATEFGFTTPGKVIKSGGKIMRIDTASLRVNKFKCKYIFYSSVKRGTYPGKFMFRQTFDETLDYFDTNYYSNASFNERLSKIVIGV